MWIGMGKGADVHYGKITMWLQCWCASADVHHASINVACVSATKSKKKKVKIKQITSSITSNMFVVFDGEHDLARATFPVLCFRNDRSENRFPNIVRLRIPKSVDVDSF